MGGVLTAIAALGEFVKLGREIFSFIQVQIQANKKEEVIKFITDVTNEMANLNQSKTTDERKEAARRVAELTARLFK